MKENNAVPVLATHYLSLSSGAVHGSGCECSECTGTSDVRSRLVEERLTPRPWRAEGFPRESYVIISGPVGQHITDFVSPDNAALILRAVNAHDDLMKACRLAEDVFARANASDNDFMGDDEHEAWTALRAAIAKGGAA